LNGALTETWNSSDPQVKQRVLTAIARLVSDPQSAYLRKLKGRPESRLRVGDWRVILELDVCPARGHLSLSWT
jgi:hypothetical protein